MDRPVSLRNTDPAGAVREQMKAAGFPMADPAPPVNAITQSCGCSFLIQGDDEPVQVGWCAQHDPGYEG